MGESEVVSDGPNHVDGPTVPEGSASERAPTSDAAPLSDTTVSETAPVSDGPESTPAPPVEPPPVEPPPVEPPKEGPHVSTLSPLKAVSRGGTPISVLGTGFLEGCRVFVDNVAIAAELVDSYTLHFEAPAHPLGPATIEVENPDGACSESGIEIVYEVGPVVLDVHPFDVPIDGGVEIVVEGSDFDPACAISIFGVHAPRVTFVSARELRFPAPSAGDGPFEGALTVTNPDGLACRIDHALAYRAPTPCIDSLDPRSGWVNGGKAIGVRGADFHKLARVFVGELEAEVRYQSPTSLDFVTPSVDAAGPTDVVVENPGGSRVVASGAFLYEPIPAPPKIIAVVPERGSTAGGLIVRIAGDNFTPSTKIRIGEVTAIARFVSPKVIEIELPSRSLPGVVAVEAADGGLAIRAEDAFTYFSPKAPRIIGLEPASGPTTGGTKVVIEGEGFPANASVRLGGVAPKHVVRRDATRLEIVTPPARSAGHVEVEVSSAETGPGTMKNGFRYEAVPSPIVESVAPNRGTVDGGSELTIEGKHFSEGVTVMIGKKPAKKVKRISGAVLEVITPEGDDGQMVDVSVKNADGKEVVAKRAFVYDARYRS